MSRHRHAPRDGSVARRRCGRFFNDLRERVLFPHSFDVPNRQKPPCPDAGDGRTRSAVQQIDVAVCSRRAQRRRSDRSAGCRRLAGAACRTRSAWPMQCRRCGSARRRADQAVEEHLPTAERGDQYDIRYAAALIVRARLRARKQDIRARRRRRARRHAGTWTLTTSGEARRLRTSARRTSAPRSRATPNGITTQRPRSVGVLAGRANRLNRARRAATSSCRRLEKVPDEGCRRADAQGGGARERTGAEGGRDAPMKQMKE